MDDSKALWLQVHGDIPDTRVTLGRAASNAYVSDPKMISFIAARYKFVAKMLESAQFRRLTLRLIRQHLLRIHLLIRQLRFIPLILHLYINRLLLLTIHQNNALMTELNGFIATARNIATRLQADIGAEH